MPEQHTEEHDRYWDVRDNEDFVEATPEWRERMYA
jgi:hypothetical protein